jgi:outer membrane protein OmpA-like peptidoglycan-associated protein
MQGADPSEFVWTPAQQQQYRTRFLTEIAPQWSGKFSFVSTRTPQSAWQDVTVTPLVQIVEDDTTPHVVLDVHRRPDDAEAVTNFIRSRDPSKPGQPLESYLTSDNLRLEAELDDPIADKSVPVTKIHFTRGHTELDERGQGELAPIVAKMTADPKSHATLRGHASSDRKAGTTVQEGFKLNLRLSRERSQAVADALKAAGIEPERILIRNWGDAGATFDEDNCRVDVAVGSHQGRQGAAHEFGHVLGLGDEYGYDELPPGARPGDPVKDPEYAKMVKDQTGIDIRRTSDESMMSKGGTLRPWHYSPFLEALKSIAGPTWKLR